MNIMEEKTDFKFKKLQLTTGKAMPGICFHSGVIPKGWCSRAIFRCEHTEVVISTILIIYLQLGYLHHIKLKISHR